MMIIKYLYFSILLILISCGDGSNDELLDDSTSDGSGDSVDSIFSRPPTACPICPPFRINQCGDEEEEPIEPIEEPVEIEGECRKQGNSFFCEQDDELNLVFVVEKESGNNYRFHGIILIKEPEINDMQ